MPSVTHERVKDFDLQALPDGFYEDPYPWYRALNAHAPVHACPDHYPTRHWFISRYADVLEIYRDVARFSSDKTREFKPKYGASPLYEHHTTSLVFNDPPLHARVRRRIAGALKLGVIAAMRANVELLVDDLLSALEEQDQVDLVADFASCIPVEVIGNLLRVPRSERAPLRDWSLKILGALEAATPEAVLDDGNRAVTQFSDYLRDLIAERRKNPSDDDDDILSRLVKDQAGDEPLTEDELIHNCIFILNAGHETTTNLIANGICLLLTHANELARLMADPALIDSAIEEFLRFESPNQLGNRRVNEDTVIGDVQLQAGDYLWLGIGAANRDPRQFDYPDDLNIARKPNAHLAFAAGVHTCAGLNVARLEAKIAIAAFFTRFPNASLAGQPTRSARARFRGFDQLPVTLGRL